MPKSPEEAMQTMIEGLRQKTGKSLEDWMKLVRRSGLQKHGEIVQMLKNEHAVTHGYANLIAHKTLGSDAVSAEAAGEDLVGQQYAGPKAALKPIYEALVAKLQRFGPDVELSPKKGYISLRRSKQFGLIQPSTATRLDVGLNLKGVPPAGRLEASGSFNAMCTHRVRVTAAKEVDSELLGWLKQAYDRA
jgi:hypothetical protein